jgi:hypothetical protein
MDKLHIGHTNDENYQEYGKLSDGTPIFRYSPPPPPNPTILKEKQERKRSLISNYNKSMEVKASNTALYVNTLKSQEEKTK